MMPAGRRRGARRPACDPRGGAPPDVRLRRGRAHDRGGAPRGRGPRPRLRAREPDPRRLPRLGEGAPRPGRASRRAGARRGARRGGVARRAPALGLRAPAPPARAQPRAGAALRRPLRGLRGLLPPLRPAPRRVRARHADRGDAHGARGAARRARPPDRRGHRAPRRRRRLVPARRVSRGRAARPGSRPRLRDAARAALVATRLHRASVRDRHRAARHPADDPLRRALPVLGAVRGVARGRPRPLLGGRGPRAGAQPAGAPAIAGDARVAEPPVGELGRARAALRRAAGRAAALPPSRGSSTTSTPSSSTAPSTACGRR